MANAKKVGNLIKNARQNAGMTQEQLARKVRNCSANDISRAERGEKELTTDQLKQNRQSDGSYTEIPARRRKGKRFFKQTRFRRAHRFDASYRNGEKAGGALPRRRFADKKERP